MFLLLYFVSFIEVNSEDTIDKWKVNGKCIVVNINICIRSLDECWASFIINLAHISLHFFFQTNEIVD